MHVLVLHVTSRPIAVESGTDVKVLFEVVAKRHVDKRRLCRRELHRRRQTSLDDGQVGD